MSVFVTMNGRTTSAETSQVAEMVEKLSGPVKAEELRKDLRASQLCRAMAVLRSVAGLHPLDLAIDINRLGANFSQADIETLEEGPDKDMWSDYIWLAAEAMGYDVEITFKKREG